MSAYIYKIHDVYVGSTDNLKRRLSEHKTNLINPKSSQYNNKIYQYIRENELRIEMKVIDTCPIDEQNIREQEWMDKLQYECNIIRAYRSPEYIKEQMKQYYDDNKEIISQYQKQYYSDNREKSNTNSKQYRINNKDKLNAHRRIPVRCECGAISTKGTLFQHRKSKKHLLFINKTN